MRIVIIGGVAGGASAATRARRLSEKAEIILLERGPYVSFANCGLPYHLGGEIAERSRLLVQTPERLNARFDLDVRVNSEAVAIHRDSKEVEVRRRDGSTHRLAYDALVLSPGAEPVRPPVPGVDHPALFTLRTLPDLDRILERLPSARRTLVVGAGYIGLEVAEAFRHRGLAVTLAERLPHVLALADGEMAAPLHAELRAHGVDLRLGTSVTAFHPEGEGFRAAFDEGSGAAFDLGVLAVGVKPETALARAAGLDIGPSGGIRVDDQMRTSDPAIWAVGDAVEVTDFATGRPALIPLAGPANRQGRIAADAILGRPSRYTASQGTAVVKVFGRTFAMTGASETRLKALGQPVQALHLHPADHATYYPGAQAIHLKLCFDPRDGRILGAQAVGGAGVDKRIDVLAVAQRAGLTVEELQDLELCYAPPYGSAKDAVNMAGFIAANLRAGDLALWEPSEPQNGALLLDVRTQGEFDTGTIPGALNRPLDELREWLEDLPRDRELRVFCQVGQRGYLACRLLTQHGFRARNLSGGYLRWQMERACLPPEQAEVASDDGRPAVPTPARHDPGA